jgi:hypothetical protein
LTNNCNRNQEFFNYDDDPSTAGCKTVEPCRVFTSDTLTSVNSAKPASTPTDSSVVPAAVDSQGSPEGNAILLFGESGSGKTTALTTLIEAGLDLFVLGTEPRFLESLRQRVIDRGLDMNKLHTAHVYPATDPGKAFIKC